MFAASLLVCSVISSKCILVEDTVGPYPTKEECHTRIAEIVTDATPYFTPPYTVSYRCEMVGEPV
jgi:hypothetical protein